MRIVYLAAAAVLSGLLALFLSSQGDSVVNQVNVQQQAFNTQELVEKFKGQEIYVLKNKSFAGEVLNDKMVEIKEWPKNGILPDHIKKDELSGLIGAAFLTPQPAGTPLLKSNLVSSANRNSYFAAIIRKGMKAKSVNIRSEDGFMLATLEPGDYIDISMIHKMNLQTTSTKTDPIDVVETLFKNVRVLAIDGQFKFAAAAEGSPPPQNNRTANNITLEVTEKMAEILSVAQKTGEISISANPLQLSIYDRFTPEEIEKKSTTAPYFIESAFNGDFKSQTVTNDVSPFISKFKPELDKVIKTGLQAKEADGNKAEEEKQKLYILRGSKGGSKEDRKEISQTQSTQKQNNNKPVISNNKQ